MFSEVSSIVSRWRITSHEFTKRFQLLRFKSYFSITQNLYEKSFDVPTFKRLYVLVNHSSIN
ncbi:hypothetical protein WJ58_08425 [Burkholderia ubonensis]|nr:hypothetical protein WJ58_08425 [Burkholderia ubonensis]